MKSTARLDFFTERFGSDFLDLRLIKAFPQAVRFKDNYGSASACSMVVLDDYEPHNPATFLCRTFLEASDDVGAQGHFILALRFYDAGTVVTVDLISFKEANSFSDIAYRHFRQDGWLPAEVKYDNDRFQETLYSPFFLANGSFKRLNSRELEFSGTTGAYGNHLISFDAGEVAKFVYNACYNSPCVTSKCVGKDLFFTVGDFVSSNKHSPDFYSLLADSLLSNSGLLDSRNSLAALLMEATDRAEREDIDLPKSVIVSNSDGLGKYLAKSGPVALICQDF